MILKFKKRRHKPLYKSLVLLKKNVQNRRRLNTFKFKKKKWEKLISFIKRNQFRRKKKFPMYDTNKYFLPKFFNSFKQKYRYMLQVKKKFKMFYASLLRRYIRKQVKITLKNPPSSLNHLINYNSFFLSLLESRLDVVLYRSHFALSVQLARQLILHKHIKVNCVTVRDYSYTLKKGDLIEISPIGSKIVELNIQNSHIWPLPPKYLNINYKVLQIIFNNTGENSQNFSILFSFWLDIGNIIRYYK